MGVAQFIHLPGDGHLDCFLFRAPMSKTTLDIHIQIFCEYIYLFLLGKYLGVELLGHMMSMFTFIRNNQTIFQSVYIISGKNSVHISANF